MEQKIIALSIRLKDPKGKVVEGIVTIKDGWAISNFKHLTIAKDLYEIEKKRNPNLFYDPDKKFLIQKYPGRSKEEIYNLLRKEFLSMGAQFTKI